MKKQGKTMEQFHKESGQSPEELRRDIVALLQWRNVLGRYYPEDKAKAYYDANKVFFDKVLVRASHILIKLPADAKKEQARSGDAATPGLASGNPRRQGQVRGHRQAAFGLPEQGKGRRCRPISLEVRCRA